MLVWALSDSIAINIATDVVFATLPVFMFYNIQVNRWTKISLMGILSLGYLYVFPTELSFPESDPCSACAAAIVKTVLQSRLFKEHDSFRYAHLPATFILLAKTKYSTNISITAVIATTSSGTGALIKKYSHLFSLFLLHICKHIKGFKKLTAFSAELNIGIIAASFPTIKPLMKRVLGSTLNFTGGASSSRYGKRSATISSSQPLQSLKRSRTDHDYHEHLIHDDQMPNDIINNDNKNKYSVRVAIDQDKGASGSAHSLDGSEEGLDSRLQPRPDPHSYHHRYQTPSRNEILRTTEVIVQREDSPDWDRDGDGGRGRFVGGRI